MSYLEKILNDRIEELKEKNKNILNQLKMELNNDTLRDTFYIEECYLDINDNEIRIYELEELKKGLGLVPVEELESEKNAVNG